ncbi:MAG TPA: hypothetical protein VGM54_05620 [Chthoniobacter sp.]
MSLEKVAAERDCLLQALKRAEEEISKARTAQQQAEGRLAEMRASGGAARSPARNDGNQAVVSQAQAAQKRAENMARTFEDQLRAQNARHAELQAAFDSLKVESEAFRERNQELQERQKDREPQGAPPVVQAAHQEQKWLRQELDNARAEIQRLRSLIVRVASEARGGTLPPELAHLKAESQPAAAGPKSGAHMAPAKSSKVEINCGPKSGARRAA